MMFGDDPAPMPKPPAVADPLAAAATPQFASGGGKPQGKGKPYGGTLLTVPGAAPVSAPSARKSLLGA